MEPGDSAPPSGDGGEIDMGAEPGPGDLNADMAASDAAAANAVKAGELKRTPLSWKDILVVVRKPFLKARRTELLPMFGTTMNDNMVRHYSIGGMLNYYLTDVLAIGVEGQYYQPSFREPFDLVARQAAACRRSTRTSGAPRSTSTTCPSTASSPCSTSA